MPTNPTTPIRTTRAQIDAQFQRLVQSERTLLRLIGREPATLGRALRLVREAASEDCLGQLLPTATPAHESAALAALEGLAGGSSPERIQAACRAMSRVRITRKALVALASGPLSTPVLQAVDATFKVRNQLLEANLGLVGRRVDSLLKRGEGGACESLRKEAMQEASMALQSAIDRFQPKLGFAFSTFAMPGVDGAIREALATLRGNIRLSDGDQRKQKAILQAETKLRREFCREPELSEIAEAVGMTLAEVDAVRQAAQVEVRIDLTPDEAMEDNVALTKEPVSEDNEATGIAAVEQTDRQRALSQALAGLPVKEARVLALRFGLEDGEELSRPAVAVEMGLRPSRVALLEAKGMERMRMALGAALRPEPCLV